MDTKTPVENGRDCFILNAAALIDTAKKTGKIKSAHAAIKGQTKPETMTYQTLLEFKKSTPQEPQNPTLDKIYVFLVNVLGLTPDELEVLSFMDVFTIVQDGDLYANDPRRAESIIALTQAQETVKQLG